MRKATALLLCVGIGSVAGGLAVAQEQKGDPAAAVPGVITKGSGDVSVGGQPAARRGDTTDGGKSIEGGSSDVFINGKPAVTMGDKTNCGGIAIGGSSNVFINGKPVAQNGTANVIFQLK